MSPPQLLAQVGEAPCVMGLLGLLSYTLGIVVGKSSNGSRSSSSTSPTVHPSEKDESHGRQ